MEDKRIKILVVDDEMEIANTIKHFLSVRGHKVTSAFSGEEALSILEKEKFDLILLDIMMHGINGTIVAKKVKDEHPGTKIFVVTAHPTEGMRLSQDVVLDGLFIKPMGIQDLYNKLMAM